MRILHVIDQISQETGGGASKACFELARSQAQLGHEVTIYTTDYNAKVQAVPSPVQMVKFKCVYDLLGSLRIAPKLLSASYDCDIMHLHNYRTLVNLFAVMRHKTFVLQAHGSCIAIRGLTKPLHDLVWGHVLFKRAKHYIADAEDEISQYIAEGAHKNDISIIPVGVNMSEFKKLERKPQKNKVVLFLGRLHKIKGCDLLIRAFRHIKDEDVKLTICGIKYGAENDLYKLVRRLGIEKRVVFIESVYGKAKAQLYTDADVYVMPSRYEMFGITFLEALACGTPVIMTDRCSASTILPPECGMVSRFDEKHLAVAIEIALDDNLAGKFRGYRRKWAQQYDWANIAKRTISLYEGVLK